MSDMYDRIVALCNEKGIRPGRVAADLGLSRGLFTDLKAGRTKELSAKNTRLIADYFGVSTDVLLGKTPKNEKNPPAENDEWIEIKNPDIRMIARGGKKMTPEQSETALKVLKALFPDIYND